MKIIRDDGFRVTIEFDHLEVIGLYTMALAINHPADNWVDPVALQHHEDVGPLSAALVVQLRGMIE